MWRHIKKRHPSKAIITKLGNDLKVRIYTYDVIGRDIYVQGMFEKAECKFVTNFLKQGMIFFDIGANLGQYTLLGAKRVGSNGRVHSFEPSSRMFSELNFNVSLNGLSNVCNLNNVAVSDKEGISKLSKYEAGGEVYGSLGNQNWAEWGKSIIGQEEVKTITLNGYIKKYNISHVDLVKIDIEGAELLALRGANQLLNRPDAPTIVLEMADITTDGFGYKALEIWDYLESFGYRMHCFNNKGNISGRAERPLDFVKAQNLVAAKSH
jgi:FkbM family methyltransferase